MHPLTFAERKRLVKRLSIRYNELVHRQSRILSAEFCDGGARMRRIMKTIAHRAVVLLFSGLLFSCAFFLNGCGTVSYESAGMSLNCISDPEAGSEASTSFPGEKETRDPGDGSAASASGKEEEEPEGLSSASGSGEKDGNDPEAAEIVIYICGEVQSPGVYRLPQGARVFDAVRAAGGLTPSADLTTVNQARGIADGEQITVFARSDSRPAGSDASASLGNEASGSAETGEKSPDTGKVNINTAGPDELQTLNGIGASRAEAIIAYRTENGAFGAIEEIMKVSGIKNSVFNRIRDDITV